MYVIFAAQREPPRLGGFGLLDEARFVSYAVRDIQRSHSGFDVSQKRALIERKGGLWTSIAARLYSLRGAT